MDYVTESRPFLRRMPFKEAEASASVQFLKAKLVRRPAFLRATTSALADHTYPSIPRRFAVIAHSKKPRLRSARRSAFFRRLSLRRHRLELIDHLPSPIRSRASSTNRGYNETAFHAVPLSPASSHRAASRYLPARRKTIALVTSPCAGTFTTAGQQ